MYKKHLCTVLTVLLMAGLNTGVFAKNIQTDLTPLNISGENSEAKTVILQVYAPEKGSSDLDTAVKSEYLDIIVYQNHVYTDAEGKYSFDISLEGNNSGIYTAVISEDGKLTEKPVYIINKDKNRTAITELNAAALLEDAIVAVEAVCDSKKDDLGLWLELMQEVDKNSTMTAFAEQIKKNQLDVDDYTSAFTLYNRIVICEALKNGKVSDISKFIEDIDFSKTQIAKWYQSDFAKEEVWKDVTERLCEANVSIEQFDDALLESFVLAVVKNPDGYGNVKSLLNDYYNKIGIKQNGKESTYEKLANTDFASFTELRTQFEKLEQEAAISRPSGGGGGGGGSFSLSPSGGASNTSVPEEIPKDIFDDLGGALWAREAIISLAQKGIIEGKGENKFCPMDNITRAEFAKILVCAFAPDSATVQNKFADLPDNAWFTPYVLRAVASGIANGISDEEFGPNFPITRQDMTVMAYNASKLMNIEFEGEETDFVFADDSSISDYAKNSVYKMYADGIISGVGNDSFEPKGNATRAQAAKIIYYILMK